MISFWLRKGAIKPLPPTIVREFWEKKGLNGVPGIEVDIQTYSEFFLKSKPNLADYRHLRTYYPELLRYLEDQYITLLRELMMEKGGYSMSSVEFLDLATHPSSRDKMPKMADPFSSFSDQAGLRVLCSLDMEDPEIAKQQLLLLLEFNFNDEIYQRACKIYGELWPDLFLPVPDKIRT